MDEHRLSSSLYAWFYNKLDSYILNGKFEADLSMKLEAKVITTVKETMH